MNFSNKVHQLSKSPKFLNNSRTILDHKCSFHLNKLNIDMNVFFNTVKKDELMVDIANYYTDYNGEYLGVIDAFFALIQNKPLEAIDRFPIKELDFYLRDESTHSAFSGYSQEIYEVLSIGEKLKTKIYGDKKIGFQYDPDVHGKFFDLSSSEQYELLEELFAYYIYPKTQKEIEVLNIDDGVIILNYVTDTISSIIKEKLFLENVLIQKEN